MLEALQNAISSNQLTYLFNNFYCCPTSFVVVCGDLIQSCIGDSLGMFADIIEVIQFMSLHSREATLTV